VHVNSDGTIGVTYYDLQNATSAQPGLTDSYLVTCPAATSDCSKAASWATGGQTRLSTTGSFDMTTAPNAGGYFVGDYEGLASSGATFDPFFVMAQLIATKGLTDRSQTPPADPQQLRSAPAPQPRGAGAATRRPDVSR
jgi:hypothetical protein